MARTPPNVQDGRRESVLGTVPLIADVPTEEPELGFKQYAAAVTKAIVGGNPPRFTVGIYGRWGSGKSTLLGAIMERLKKDHGDTVIPVMFDAWRYESSPAIIVPLVQHIAAAIKSSRSARVRRSAAQLLTRFLTHLEADVLWGLVTVRKGHPGDLGSAVNDLIRSDSYARSIQLLKEFSLELTARDVRIVVLVDDLDRCSPDKIVNVVETVKVVLDIEGLVSVIAIDYERLVDALYRKYPKANAHSFMEKIVQAEFHVPGLTLDQQTFLADLRIPALDAAAGPTEGLNERIHGISTGALESNPRQIKRFINTFLLYRAVLEQTGTVNENVLAAVIGFQLGYPASYQAWRKSGLTTDTEKITALVSDFRDSTRVSDPLRPMSANEYVNRFMKDLPKDDFEGASMQTNRLRKVAAPDVVRYVRGRLVVEVGWQSRVPEIDADVSAFLVGPAGRATNDHDIVYYNNPQSPDGSIRHLGDVLTRGVGGEQIEGEEIEIELPAVGSDIERVYLSLSIYDAAARGASLADLTDIQLRITENRDERDVVRHSVGGIFTTETGAVIGVLTRVGDEWQFARIRKTYDGGLLEIGREFGIELGTEPGVELG